MITQKRILIVVLSLIATSCGTSPSGPGGTSTSAGSEKVLCTGADSEKWEAYGGGDGTQENPYLICTVNHFKTIQGDLKNKRFFRLTADLDFANEKDLSIIAIAPYASIDGTNHVLRNITLRHGNGYKSSGIFGQLTRDYNGNRDEVKNLIIENAAVYGDGKEDSGGIIAAANWGGIISNVHVRGIVQMEYPNAKADPFWSAGGLVGVNASLIEDCSFAGQVSGAYNVGGIAGRNDGIIRNSRTEGTVKGIQGVGGTIGVQMKSGINQGSHTTASVTAKKHFGNPTGIVCAIDDYAQCLNTIHN